MIFLLSWISFSIELWSCTNVKYIHVYYYAERFGLLMVNRWCRHEDSYVANIVKVCEYVVLNIPIDYNIFLLLRTLDIREPEIQNGNCKSEHIIRPAIPCTMELWLSSNQAQEQAESHLSIFSFLWAWKLDTSSTRFSLDR